jgi:two-component sensor histidine kinase
MGWQLITMLASQLKGRLEIANEGGASVSFFLGSPA